MDNLIDIIKSKSNSIREKREHFYNKLIELQRTVSEAIGNISIYAQSKSIVLDAIGMDDWIYGYLYVYDGNIKIAYRSTEDDFTDSMNGISKEDWSYNVKELGDSKIEWLEKLSSEESIKSLLVNIDKSLDEVYEKSNQSINSLDKALVSQSNIISDGVIEVLKSIGDDNLHRDWLKARNQILIEPSASITRSSSYLESVCLKILIDLSEPLPNNKDITNLINAVVKVLNITENKEAEKDFKQLFGSVKGIFQSVGILRTHFGIAHGSNPGSIKLNEHCARLVNDIAGTVSVFIFNRFNLKITDRKIS